ncbi:MAG: hypothetical protein GKR97_14060 [Rhizobiaceae bacterium]|nr:hypothetical protein [Rhizobiaceae bacterium]
MKWAAAALLLGLVSQPTLTIANEENPDPVYVFNRICYAQVHDLDAIQTMALKLAWKSITEEELSEFKSYENPKVLRGWDVQVGERLFRVGITQAGLTDKMKETFSDFADGTATSCSMVLDDQQDAADFLPNMQTLAGKEPVSSDVPEGLLRTTTWAGGNADLKVFLFAKAPPTGKGGLLNVTILQKKL